MEKIRALIKKAPIVMIIVGVLGISVSSILVRFSDAPSPVTAAFRLIFTVLLLTNTHEQARGVA